MTAGGLGRFVFLWTLVLCFAAQAQSQKPQVFQLNLQRTTEALYLSARMELSPEQVVEETLLKSVPLYFVWQADIYRERWYWTDRRIATVTRTLRLAYQPLTRRWRVSLSNDAGAIAGGAGLQYALHQNYDTLADALAGVGRVTRWKLVEAARLSSDEAHYLEFAFRLDLSLLPRPFQIGIGNQREWSIEVRDRINVPPRAEPDRPPAPAAPLGESVEVPPSASARIDAEAAAPAR
ncbi:DUF4390 domain-containing protein [Hydrogenophaga sp.]|uniref:DUF4390 domain-containing protein n=1 Tax=Hydrogenophaga sp. TaxID=1904254 RepID=UPI00261E8E2E|nr:DUF4390 domain-containing protein [Hydrogenophaga sp.]